MDVVINSECAVIPEGSSALASQGSVLLNFLSCLGYDFHNPPVADLLSIYHKLKAQDLEETLHPTSRGLTAGSRNLATSLDPAVKPRDVGIEYGNWLVISPIHWQATHNDALILAVGKKLDLSKSEIEHWYQLFSKHVMHEGMTLYFHDADYWLLNADGLPEITAKPVYQLVNKSFMPELEQLDSSMYWQKFITESQMFFAAQPNVSALNGVWAWGGGSRVKKEALSICADESFFDLASICSSKVTLYSPQVELNDFKIILLNNQELLSESHKKELTKKAVNWFWNNAAYAVDNGNWLTRLWRNIIHAH